MPTSPLLLCALLVFAIVTTDAMRPPKDVLGNATRKSNMQTLRYSATTGKYKFSENPADGVVAVQASSVDTVMQNGWLVFRLTDENTQLAPESTELYYGAGYAEGYLTQHRTYQSWLNTLESNGTVSKKLGRWVWGHIGWMQQQVKYNAEHSLYWKTVSNILAQLDGVVAGYQAAAPNNEQLGYIDIFLLNFVFEIEDVELAIDDYLSTVKKRKGGCSALVRVTDDDLFVAHNTWSTFETMLRAYKSITLSGRRQDFSGYPGIIASGDDWYSMSNGYGIIETTNDIYADLIYYEIQQQSVSEFIRVMVANHVMTSGQSWMQTFCMHNSGTYNNQWMVVNMNAYTPGKPIAPGTLWVTEQLPQICIGADQSTVLQSQGYWSSFNIPYYKQVFDATMAPEMVEDYTAKWGWFFSHSLSTRPVLFQTMAPKVTSLADMKMIMRYNNYTTDPLSECKHGGCTPKYSAMLALAPRGDLNPTNGDWGWLHKWLKQRDLAATDAKIMQWSKMIGTGGVVSPGGHIVCGPTFDSEDIEPFQWSTSPYASITHEGMPDVYDFGWVDTDTL